EAMEGAWGYQPASQKREGLHTQGRHQMETNRRGCCKQPVSCSQRKVEAMEGAWSYQPAFPNGEGLHTRGRYQMETVV
ncbi:2944_t:CDS:2, partial [Gigaspora rosea]